MCAKFYGDNYYYSFSFNNLNGNKCESCGPKVILGLGQAVLETNFY